MCAGPVDFGLNEVNAALASRNLKWKLKYELNLEGPDTFRIEPYGYGGGHVTGGDMRGLMYGLLEAADQIRATGRLTLMYSTPAIPLRAVRMFVSTGDLNKYSEDFWRDYFLRLLGAKPAESLHAGFFERQSISTACRGEKWFSRCRGSGRTARSQHRHAALHLANLPPKCGRFYCRILGNRFARAHRPLRT